MTAAGLDPQNAKLVVDLVMKVLIVTVTNTIR